MLFRTACVLLALSSPVGAFWRRAEEKEIKEAAVEKQEELEYGADISFPMLHERVSTNYPWLPHNMDESIETPEEYKDMPIQPLGDKQTFYENYVNGCVEFYGEKGSRCTQTEHDRVEMTLRQPQSMKNYTKDGFAKIKAPEPLMNLLYKFWKANEGKQSSESWGGACLSSS